MRTSKWLIHTLTDTQTGAMTIPGGQNWPRVKISKYKCETQLKEVCYATLGILRPFWVVFPTEGDRNTCLCKTFFKLQVHVFLNLITNLVILNRNQCLGQCCCIRFCQRLAKPGALQFRQVSCTCEPPDVCMAHDGKHAIFAENGVYDTCWNSPLKEWMVCHDFSNDLEKCRAVEVIQICNKHVISWLNILNS